MAELINILVFLLLLGLGYFIGRMTEARHYKSIIRREKVLNRIPAIATKLPDPSLNTEKTMLVTGSVVISVDYFKRFLAVLRNFVGGRIKSYESLLDRARREAILRMKDEARRKGAALVFNVKLETSSISKGMRDQIGSIEVLAYGTALKLKADKAE